MTDAFEQPKGKQLEIIVDACSMKPEILKRVDMLIEHVMNADPRVYSDYRITVPNFIRMETDQLLFEDMVRPNMIGNRTAREFYEKHQEHIVAIETPEIAAYRIAFAKIAADNAQRLRHDEIGRNAEKLQKRLNLTDTPITHLEVKDFLQSVSDAYQRFTENRATKPDQGELAAFSNEFFANCSTADRCILQSMMYYRPVRTRADKNLGFREAVDDAGEVAITRVINERAQTDDTPRVTLVISNDYQARKLIRRAETPAAFTPIVMDDKMFHDSMLVIEDDAIPNRKDWGTLVKHMRAVSVKDASAHADILLKAIETGVVDAARLKDAANEPERA